jgi:hypothetical protein
MVKGAVSANVGCWLATTAALCDGSATLPHFGSRPGCGEWKGMMSGPGGCSHGLGQEQKMGDDFEDSLFWRLRKFWSKPSLVTVQNSEALPCISKDHRNCPGRSESGILVASSQQWRGFCGHSVRRCGERSPRHSLFRRTRPSSCPSRQLASTAAFDAWQIISRTRVICKLYIPSILCAHPQYLLSSPIPNSRRSIRGRLLHSTPEFHARVSTYSPTPHRITSYGLPPGSYAIEPTNSRALELPTTYGPTNASSLQNHLQLSRPWESTIPSRHPWRVSTAPATTGASRHTDTDEFVSPAECKKCGKILTSFVDPRQPLGPEKIIPPSVLANAKV